MDLGILRDQVVQVRADRLGRAVAEQPLRSGVPEADGHLLVDHDDGGRTHLDQGLEEPALANQLADVLEHRERADEPAVDHDRNGSEHDVDERAVLPRAARHELGRFGEHPLVDRLGLRTDGFVIGHQLVDVPSDRLLLPIPEQALGRRIPRHDDQLRVAGDDRRWGSPRPASRSTDAGRLGPRVASGVDIDAKRRASDRPPARRAERCLRR